MENLKGSHQYENDIPFLYCIYSSGGKVVPITYTVNLIYNGDCKSNKQ